MRYKCNGHGHLKKECPNYLRGKGKVFATTLSDFESSNSDMEGECDSEGYRAFMEITSIDSKARKTISYRNGRYRQYFPFR